MTDERARQIAHEHALRDERFDGVPNGPKEWHEITIVINGVPIDPDGWWDDLDPHVPGRHVR